MIHLVPFEVRDFPRLISWIDTPELLIQWSGPRQFRFPLDATQLTVHLYETLTPTPRARIYKALTDEGLVVGHAEFGGINTIDGTATLCRVMVAPEVRGRGYCLPLVRSALKIGFDELHFRRIELNVYAFNREAIACYERAGFGREGILRQTVELNGRFWDTIAMAMLKEDWKLHEGDDVRPSPPGSHGKKK